MIQGTNNNRRKKKNKQQNKMNITEKCKQQQQTHKNFFIFLQLQFVFNMRKINFFFII